MKFPVSNSRLAAILRCPAKNVAAHWPLIEQSLDGLGIYSDRCAIAALATVRVECPTFEPVKEYGGKVYLNRRYDTRTDLGNTAAQDGDGAVYAGRGFIQITGKLNYEHFGKLLGVDLIDDPADPSDDSDPDKALNPHLAAAILAAYFYERKVYEAANRRDWRRVRRLVNGGYNGWEDFIALVGRLEAELERTAANAEGICAGDNQLPA